MGKAENLKRVTDSKLVAIVRAPSAEEALRTVEAIHAGGVGVIEVTMTVPGALRVLEELAAKLGSKVLLGAGTVLDPETARACILAGAEFLVSPNLNVKVIETARRYSKVSVPAGLTPTEIVTAWEAGADFVKVFPCGNLGGADYIKALKAPLPQVDLIPTGGVSLKTAADFIKAGASALGVGADLVDLKAVREGRAGELTDRARQFVEIVRQARQG
jgi:2-dehydro-3-deoxyphosphogluconate aldolase/(4S)-4-hydroxy-2-oxoglutarate aldolase